MKTYDLRSISLLSLRLCALKWVRFVSGTCGVVFIKAQPDITPHAVLISFERYRILLAKERCLDAHPLGFIENIGYVMSDKEHRQAYDDAHSTEVTGCLWLPGGKYMDKKWPMSKAPFISQDAVEKAYEEVYG
jgi:hypothetical protein